MKRAKNKRSSFAKILDLQLFGGRGRKISVNVSALEKLIKIVLKKECA